MLERKSKSHKWYLLFRLYVAIVFIGSIIFLISWFVAFASDQGSSSSQMMWFAVWFPCFSIAVFMIMNAYVFRFKYSILGHLERTAFPNEQSVLIKTGSWGQFGLFRTSIPLFNWYIFPSGLGISILGIGKVFISEKYIKEINENGKSFYSSSHYQLVHISPEMHRPVFILDKAVFETLRTVVRMEPSKNEHRAAGL
ncbi:hypothetical protein ACFLTN_04590 [Chloroflexota bacterium]